MHTINLLTCSLPPYFSPSHSFPRPKLSRSPYFSHTVKYFPHSHAFFNLAHICIALTEAHFLSLSLPLSLALPYLSHTSLQYLKSLSASLFLSPRSHILSSYLFVSLSPSCSIILYLHRLSISLTHSHIFPSLSRFLHSPTFSHILISFTPFLLLPLYISLPFSNTSLLSLSHTLLFALCLSISLPSLSPILPHPQFFSMTTVPISITLSHIFPSLSRITLILSISLSSFISLFLNLSPNSLFLSRSSPSMLYMNSGRRFSWPRNTSSTGSWSSGIVESSIAAASSAARMNRAGSVFKSRRGRWKESRRPTHSHMVGESPFLSSPLLSSPR
jgi:hypothetical protein